MMTASVLAGKIKINQETITDAVRFSEAIRENNIREARENLSDLRKDKSLYKRTKDRFTQIYLTRLEKPENRTALLPPNERISTTSASRNYAFADRFFKFGVAAAVTVTGPGCAAMNPATGLPVGASPRQAPVPSLIEAKLDPDTATVKDLEFVENEIKLGDITRTKSDQDRIERQILSLLDGRTGTPSPAIKKTALRMYLLARSMAKQNRKTAVNEVDTIYKQWKSESLKPGTTVTITIRGRDYSGIGKILASDTYIHSAADIIEIQNLTEKGQLSDAITKAKAVLADSDATKDVKKQALFCLLDAKSRSTDNYADAIKFVDDTYELWKVETRDTFTITIDGIAYQGIGKLDPTYEGYMYAHAAVSKAKNLLEQGQIEQAKTASINILKGSNYAGYVKKQALATYLDALSRASENHNQAIIDAFTIFKDWDDKSEANPNSSYSVTIGTDNIQGIEALRSEDNSILDLYWNIKLERDAIQRIFNNRPDETASDSVDVIGR